MKGEIGTLSRDGEQVAGFLDWEAHVQTDIPVSIGDIAPTRIVAKSFWLLEEIEPGEYEAAFYQRKGKNLDIIMREKVIADWPPCVSDKVIRHEMEMGLL